MVYVYLIREVPPKSKKKRLDCYATKIGVARNIAKRLESLQIGNPRKLELVVAIPFKSRHQAMKAEKKLHVKFKHKNIRGEWFFGELPLVGLGMHQIEVEKENEENTDTYDENVIYSNHFRSI